MILLRTWVWRRGATEYLAAGGRLGLRSGLDGIQLMRASFGTGPTDCAQHVTTASLVTRTSIWSTRKRPTSRSHQQRRGVRLPAKRPRSRSRSDICWSRHLPASSSGARGRLSPRTRPSRRPGPRGVRKPRGPTGGAVRQRSAVCAASRRAGLLRRGDERTESRRNAASATSDAAVSTGSSSGPGTADAHGRPKRRPCAKHRWARRISACDAAERERGIWRDERPERVRGWRREREWAGRVGERPGGSERKCTGQAGGGAAHSAGKTALLCGVREQSGEGALIAREVIRANGGHAESIDGGAQRVTVSQSV